MFFRRHLSDVLLSGASNDKVRLLFGARQTGKTALLAHLLAGAETASFNLQDSSLRRRLESDPSSFSREVRALPRATRHVLVDEVQKVPALLDEIQDLYDADPTRYQFFLTGSSARRLRTHSSNLLPGRSHVYSIYPISRWETDTHLADSWPWSQAATPCDDPPFPAQGLERMLVYGGLPGVRQENPDSAPRTLEAYVENYVEEEIRREAAARDLGAFSTFLRLAAFEAGRTINLAHLSQETGIAATTVRNFYQVLVDTFIGHWMEPYSRPGRKRLLSTPRFYFFDLGVRNAAARLALDDRLLDSGSGPLFEQWVALELLARAGYRGRSHRVSFWRTKNGAEVDFVYEAPREDVPIEVKWTSRPRPGDARHVETFLDLYPERAHRGVVICRVEQVQQLTDRVVALPWSAL